MKLMSDANFKSLFRKIGRLIVGEKSISGVLKSWRLKLEDSLKFRVQDACQLLSVYVNN
jgi:hypothetical protein